MKCLKLIKPIMGSCLFETFRWDLKWDMLFETFQPITGVGYLKLSDETWNEICYLKRFNPSQELVIWSFQMRHEMRCAIWNFSTHHRSWLFEAFRWVLTQDMLFEIFETFWHLKLFKLFKPIMGIAYLKLSDETWKNGAIWNFWNLKLCSWNYLKPLMCPLRTKKFQLTLNLEVINLLVHRVDICC